MNKNKLIELRCKAWGITENEYYCKQCSDFSLEDMARAYRRGKNKGAADKAIQNVGFYQKQMEAIYDKKNKQIAELEKENAELKDKLNNLSSVAEVRLGMWQKYEKENAELKKESNQLFLEGAKRVEELEAQIEKMKCCTNCKHSRTEYEHCRTDKHEKWEIKEK